MEDRIERLENLVTLQDRTIEKLNDALFDQQRQIQGLEKLAERLARKVKVLEEALDDSGGLDAPPPHYNG